MLGYDLGDIKYGNILETGVVDTGYFGMVNEVQIDICNVINMNVRAGLISTKHGDLAFG